MLLPSVWQAGFIVTTPMNSDSALVCQIPSPRPQLLSGALDLMIAFSNLNMLFSSFSLFFPVKNMGQCRCSCLIRIEVSSHSLSSPLKLWRISLFLFCKGCWHVLKQPKFWVLFPSLCPELSAFLCCRWLLTLVEVQMNTNCKALCAVILAFVLEILAHVECAWIWEVRKCMSKCGGEPLSFGGAHKSL